MDPYHNKDRIHEIRKDFFCTLNDIQKFKERYMMLFYINYVSCATTDRNIETQKIILPLFSQNNYDPLNDYKTDCMLMYTNWFH